MSVNEMTARIDVDDEEISESVVEVLDALMDAMPILATATTADATSSLQGAISIDVQQPVQLTIRTTMATGLKLAEGWCLAEETGPTETDAIDAMGEFTNLVGGSMKFLFSEESALGLPVVETDAEPAERHWIEVDHTVGVFHVELHRR